MDEEPAGITVPEDVRTNLKDLNSNAKVMLKFILFSILVFPYYWISFTVNPLRVDCGD